jgi:glycogen(starch) synthase
MISASICIATYDRPESLRKCLASLKNQTYKNFEVVVVEGGNIKITNQLVHEFKGKIRMKVYEQRAKGLTNARNETWKHASGKICAFIDDDVIVDSKWLENIMTSYSKGIAGVGGPSLISKNLLQSRDITNFLLTSSSFYKKIIRDFYFKFFLENRQFEINRFFKSGCYSIGSMIPKIVRKINSIFSVEYLDASNMSFRRNVLKKVGGFDNIFSGVGDCSEPDLCFRIREQGYLLIFNPQAIVNHYPSKGYIYTKRSNAYDRSKNLTIFVKRHFGISLKFILFCGFLSNYYFYKTLSERNFNWLLGILGLVTGIKSTS